MLIQRAIYVPLVAGVLLTSCASQKPFEYHSATEIPVGAGIVSGEDGAFILYSTERKDALISPLGSDSPERLGTSQSLKQETEGVEEKHWRLGLRWNHWECLHSTVENDDTENNKLSFCALNFFAPSTSEIADKTIHSNGELKVTPSPQTTLNLNIEDRLAAYEFDLWGSANRGAS